MQMHLFVKYSEHYQRSQSTYPHSIIRIIVVISNIDVAHNFITLMLHVYHLGVLVYWCIGVLLYWCIIYDS